MRLLEVQLTNFRCFESLSVHFDPESNVHVFVGDNGAGKSAILDAIALGLAPIARRFGQSPGGRRRNLLDITETAHHQSAGVAIFDNTPPKPFCYVQFKGRPNGHVVEWDTHLLRDKSKRSKAKLPTLIGNKHLNEALDEDVFQVAEHPDGEAGTVPVYAYYGTSRAVLDIPQRQRNFESAFSRGAALKNALDPVSRFKDAFEWFFAMERDELALQNRKQEFRFRLPVLDTVRRAIQGMLPEFTEPRITTHPLHFQLSRKNEDSSVTDLFAEQLSDGYRTMLALVMDFARRLAQANPKMTDPLQAEAVLLIDEVDLHLHPDWQQTIVPQLQITFPNTQLILTTHSPQVLTSVHSRSVNVLRSGKLHRSPEGIYGAESKRTLERVMLIPSRPPKNARVQKLENLFSLISAGKLEEAKGLAAVLSAEFSGNEPAVDEALTMIENRLWEKEVGL
jgi:predicted ATP-binding protein involved in virulence